jgi:hypothetical protein
MRLKLTALALVILSPLSAFAQDPVPAPAPAPEAPPASEPLPPPPPPPVVETAPLPPAPEPAPAAPSAGPIVKWEGLVDSYYQYNFTGDPSTQNPAGRAYDTQANSFTLSYAKLGVGVEAGDVGARLDFGFGQTAAIVNTGSAGLSGGSAALKGQLYGSSLLVEQAYATLKLGGGMFVLDAGKFNTSAGAEVIPANKNWLYSRSLLFNGITVNHTGLRGTFTISPAFTLQASVVNGWNNDPDNNGDKTFGLSALITPVDGTFIGINGYFGQEATTGTPDPDPTFLVDVVVNQNFGEAFALNLNFDYFKFGDANWLGAALMGKFSLAPSAYLAARGEFVKSSDGGYVGVTGMPIDHSLYEGTVMLGLPFGSNYEMRIEARGDFSNEDVFMKGAEPKSSQFTGTAAFLAWF